MSEPPIAVTTSADQHPRLRADGLDERLAQREAAEADQEVADREDAEAGHQAALEAEAVDDRAGEEREEVEQRVEDGAGEEGRGLGAEADLLGDEDGEHGLAAVVGEALEELEHVRDPERAAEAAAQRVEEAQGTRPPAVARIIASSSARSNRRPGDNVVLPRTGENAARALRPPAAGRCRPPPGRLALPARRPVQHGRVRPLPRARLRDAPLQRGLPSFRDGCGLYDLRLPFTTTPLPLRSYLYIGSVPALPFYPFWRLIGDPVAVRVQGAVFFLRRARPGRAAPRGSALGGRPRRTSSSRSSS